MPPSGLGNAFERRSRFGSRRALGAMSAGKKSDVSRDRAFRVFSECVHPKITMALWAGCGFLLRNTWRVKWSERLAPARARQRGAPGTSLARIVVLSFFSRRSAKKPERDAPATSKDASRQGNRKDYPIPSSTEALRRVSNRSNNDCHMGWLKAKAAITRRDPKRLRRPKTLPKSDGGIAFCRVFFAENAEKGVDNMTYMAI